MRLDDPDSFTLVPASMATGLASADITPLRLTDPDLPTIDLELVWRRDYLSPGTALFLNTAQALTHTWSAR